MTRRARQALLRGDVAEPVRQPSHGRGPGALRRYERIPARPLLRDLAEPDGADVLHGRGPGTTTRTLPPARLPAPRGPRTAVRSNSSVACIDADPGTTWIERVRQPGSPLRGDVAEPDGSDGLHGRDPGHYVPTMLPPHRLLALLGRGRTRRARRPAWTRTRAPRPEQCFHLTDSLLRWDLPAGGQISCIEADSGHYVPSDSSSQVPCSKDHSSQTRVRRVAWLLNRALRGTMDSQHRHLALWKLSAVLWPNIMYRRQPGPTSIRTRPLARPCSAGRTSPVSPLAWTRPALRPF